MKTFFLMISLFCTSAWAADLPLEEVDCEVLLNAEHPLGPAGRLRLVDLNLSALKSAGRAEYFATIKTLTQKEFPELNVSDQDRVLALDIRGDKQGYFRSYFVAALSQDTNDIVGVNVISLSYKKVDFTEKPTARVVIIVKPKITDYRDGSNPIETTESLVSWLALQIDEKIFQFTKVRALNLTPRNPHFQIAYDLLATSPRDDSQLTPEQFAKAYPLALAKLQSGLTAKDLLYFRPSFWDEDPKPDEFAKKAYALMTQGSTTDFEKNFRRRVLSYRASLRDWLHARPVTDYYNYLRTTTPSSFSFSPPSIRSGESTALSGVSTQQTFGTDFYTGANHVFQDLDAIRENFAEDLNPLVDILEQQGITQLVQLQSMSADDLMNRCHFNLAELRKLAEALTSEGVFLHYSFELRRRLGPQDHLLFARPENQFFVWDPVNRKYRLKSKKGEPGK